MGTRGGDRRSKTGYVNERQVTWEGRTQSIKAWALELGRSPNVMVTRIKKWDAGIYTPEQAMGRDKLPRGWKSAGQGKSNRPPLSDVMAAYFDVPYHDDEFAQCVVDSHLGEGLGLDRIGELYGLSRERIRQIEESAMRKIRRICGKGARAAEIIELLRGIDAERRVNMNAFAEEEQIEHGDHRSRRRPRRAA